ncbi:MAG: histidine phosphatase family protein [Burkholderiaceae bacterium]
MKLWLARHAQPLIGAGICYGALDVAADAALTTAAAKSVAATLPANTICRVSPIRRCQQLAAALALMRPDLAIKSSTCTDGRLAEMDFGHFEGQPWVNIPKAAVDAWTADFGNHRFGGKESANEVLQRVKAALDEHAALQADNVLWITHAGVIRACSLAKQGIYRVETPEQWPQAVVEFGCCVNIDYS